MVRLLISPSLPTQDGVSHSPESTSPFHSTLTPTPTQLDPVIPATPTFPHFSLCTSRLSLLTKLQMTGTLIN